MEQKIILLALVAGILFLAGCASPGTNRELTEQEKQLKLLCENSGGAFVGYLPCPPDAVSCPLSPIPCKCPSGKTVFDSKYGCMDEQTLATARLCDSSGGRYNYCTVEACISSCICPPGMDFQETVGCVAPVEPDGGIGDSPPPPPE